MRQAMVSSSAHRQGRFWLGILFSVVCVAWLLVRTDWAATWQAVITTNYRLVLIATLVNFASIPLRSLRWQAMFPIADKPPLGRLTAIMLIGQAVNVIMPARMGDLLKANLVGTSSAALVISTIILQSILDLVMVSGLIIILLFTVSLPGWMQGSAQALLLTTLVALVGIAVFALSRMQIIALLERFTQRWSKGKTGSRQVSRLKQMAEQFLQGFTLLRQPNVMITLLVWSIFIWLTYGAVNYILLRAVGIPQTWLMAFFVLVVLQVGTAVPSSPGRVGVYHYLSVEALSAFAVAETGAVSFAIIAHIISIVLPMLLGLALAWKMGIFKEARL